MKTSTPATWGLDPLFNAHVKLFLVELGRTERPEVDEVHAAAADAVRFLRFSPGTPLRPIRLVHIAGFVVNAYQFQKVCTTDSFFFFWEYIYFPHSFVLRI